MVEREPRFFIKESYEMKESTQQVIDRDVFAIKQEMHTESRNEGIISDVGQLSNLSPSNNWAGSICLDKRRKSEELSELEVDLAIHSVGDFFASCTPGTRVRCIDGRTLLGYDDNSLKSLFGDLGPQIPGGNPSQAMCYRMAIKFPLELGDNDQLDDMKVMSEIEAKTGFLSGNHSDKNNYISESEKTGCGAVDTTIEQLMLFEPENISGINQLTSVVLGDDFDPIIFNQIAESADNLRQQKKEYFAEKSDIFKAIKAENNDGIALLEGAHNEILTIINTIEGTTFNRDHFSATNEGKIQAFNYDIWYEYKVAEALSSDPAIQSRFIHARIATAVAALMRLTNGSLRTLKREPRTELG